MGTSTCSLVWTRWRCGWSAILTDDHQREVAQLLVDDRGKMCESKVVLFGMGFPFGEVIGTGENKNTLQEAKQESLRVFLCLCTQVEERLGGAARRAKNALTF